MLFNILVAESNLYRMLIFAAVFRVASISAVKCRARSYCSGCLDLDAWLISFVACTCWAGNWYNQRNPGLCSNDRLRTGRKI